MVSLVTACGSGPKVTVCLLDEINSTLECSDPSGHKFSLAVKDAHSYACMTLSDVNAIYDYMKLKCSGK